VQKIITTSKGVSIDYDSVGRDAKAQSKELYTWGQDEDEDIKDVTDRLAFMNYVHGSLSSTLAVSLNDSRASLKELRNAETELAPRRNARANLESQISKIEHNQDAKSQSRLIELHEQLKKSQEDDAALEKEILVLKRKAVRESETAKWAAVREYAEKLVLVAQAATIATSAMPTVPPTPSQPYTGGSKTAGARASLQRALDNYRTGHIHLPSHEDSMASHASSTASFGETHGPELQSLNTADLSHTTQPGLPFTPVANPTVASPQSTVHNLPPTSQPGTFSPPQGPPPGAHSPPPPVPIPGTAASHTPTSPVINPALLNQSPAPLPSSPPASVPAAVSASPLNIGGDTQPAKLPSVTPTVAETGIPVSQANPGPASGSLRDLHKDSASSVPPAIGAAAPAPAFESAEDEKKRLEREDRERVLAGMTTGGGPPAEQAYESAEDEKRRLEREERERILHQGTASNQHQPPRDGNDGAGEDLPAYQEPTLM